MLSGRLRRRALALLGALLLVILIWPPCCATMPKLLPAVLPTVPQIDLPPDPIPAVAVVVQQHQQQNKSRKASDLSRFMNVLLVGPSVDSGESGPRARSTHAAYDDSQRTLKLPRRENSSASYPIESSIDKNTTNEQQTVSPPSSSPRLDNGGRDPTAVKSGSTYQPATIFSILSQRTSPRPTSAATPQVRGVDLQVNDRGGVVPDVVAVNQSVFNPTPSPHQSPLRRHPFLPHSRAARSAGDVQHHHRHQHHYLTGEGTLARRGGGGGRHQNHQHNQTVVEAAAGDSSNLERNERSANLSHITGANRKIQLYIKNRYLQLLADGTVNGTHDDQSEFTILQRTTVAAGQIRIQGVATCLFLCMDTCGTVYGSRAFTDDCVFNEQMEQHHYNTYSSTAHSNGRRTLYLALNKTGGPRKIQIPVNRTLGKLATYTKALTQTVAHDRVERLIARLFGANHVRHGLKQLCETGVLPEVEMRPRPVCPAAGQVGVVVKPGVGKGVVGMAAGGGANKDKDSKDTMRKKKKKRRKCRDDEQPGEHCFRPAAASSSSSLGTNSNRRKLPPGQLAKSQQQVRCGGDEGECVDSPSSTTSVSSSNSSNSHNRASTTVPNAVESAASTPKKKVAKKVNNRNTPPNVNNKKPKGGGGGAAAGPNKKAKQQQNSNSSSSSSISTVPLTAKAKTKAMTAARMTPRTTRSTTTTTTTSTTTPPPPSSSSTVATLDDTSRSEDDEEQLLMDMDELAALHQLSSAEIIEEDELDEGSTTVTTYLKPSASPWHEPESPAQSSIPPTTTTTEIPVSGCPRFLATATLVGLSLGCWSLRARPLYL